jgi:N-acetylmuramate 1-kinase
MTSIPDVLELDESGLAQLAELVACELSAGDIVALSGDLGAGKSAFARSAIRARLGDPSAEVPSPTFSLLQTYDTPPLTITHGDLYRLDDANAAEELGLDEALIRGALIIEWPERAPALVSGGGLGPDRLEISLFEIDGGARRRVEITGHGQWAPRLPRLVEIARFIAASGWSSARVAPMPGDASSRRYFKLAGDCGRALVMDAPRQPDGPPIRDGKPYSRIAHLAEDVRPFVAIARHLNALGLSAPEILASDLDAGLLLIEDLGDRVFGAELASGTPQVDLWRVAVDALLVLHAAPVSRRLPIGNGEFHDVPDFDLTAMEIEIELLPEWYLPMMTGAPTEGGLRRDFMALWQPVLQRLLAEPPALLLRDYHSPNLLWIPERTGTDIGTGAANVGIIDFQDAMISSAAYDLVSVLQDARLDVPEAIETELLAHYCERAAKTQKNFDPARFHFAYRAFGAERNTKILGIFARLAMRDHKPRYLQHIPRIWRYLERDLAHPGLSSLRAWYDRTMPKPTRSRIPGA